MYVQQPMNYYYDCNFTRTTDGPGTVSMHAESRIWQSGVAGGFLAGNRAARVLVSIVLGAYGLYHKDI